MAKNRLKMLREQHGLSQAELGDRLGVTQQSVFAWEHEKTTPQIQTAIELCRMYGVSMDYLLGLSDDPGNTKKPATEGDELKEYAVERVSALPKSELRRLLTLMDSLPNNQAAGSADAAAPQSSDQSDSE